MSKYNQMISSWREVLQILQLTPSGRALLQLLPTSQRVKNTTIKPIPDTVREQLLNQLPQFPIGALFCTDGTEGFIFIDFKSELGILAPYLFHELTHAIDESLWAAPNRKLTHSDKKELIFKSELRAFYAQHQFIKELKHIEPSLSSYYLSRYPHIPFLHRGLQPSEVAEFASQALNVFP